jgi:hypothetical protein
MRRLYIDTGALGVLGPHIDWLGSSPRLSNKFARHKTPQALRRIDPIRRVPELPGNARLTYCDDGTEAHTFFGDTRITSPHRPPIDCHTFQRSTECNFLAQRPP